MGVTSYLTVNGEILSETRNGVQADYIPDPQGSTAALINASQVITDTFTWWAYGEQRSHVGSSVTPFGYQGTLGYHTDGASGRIYVRASTLDPSLTRWLTVDRLWPSMAAYAYCFANPTNYVDPEGTKPQKHRKTCPPGWRLVSVTCYGKADRAHPRSSKNAAYGSNPNCGGCNRDGRTGDCANDTSHGRKPVCGAGQTVTIAYPGPGSIKIKAKCVVCDTGQGHNGIDFYVDVPDSDCDKHFNETTYCVKCN